MKNFFRDQKELLGSRVMWSGTHRGIVYEYGCVCREPSNFMEYDKAWCSYVILKPEQHEKLKAIINDAPWNGDQTYYRKHSVEHIDVSEELKAQWDGHYFKIGDDFQHLWDDGKHDLYDPQFIKEHIIAVVNYFADALEKNEQR